MRTPATIYPHPAAQGEQCEMSGEFMKKIFEAIHEESVRQQMEIINK